MKMPISFVFRRIHSLTGLLLVLFLFEHLITNSQAAYWLDEGHGFVKIVNLLQSIPYLRFIEVTLIGIPVFFHAMWGITYIQTSKNNTNRADGTKPSLKFSRNIAYNWQRITSYIVIVLLIFHVVQMRFVKHPQKISFNNEQYFLVKVKEDKNLYPIAKKMDATLIYDNENITNQTLKNVVDKFKLRKGELVAMTKQSGQAFLLTVRDTFKNPYMIGIYCIFVVAASFHAINGLWTFLLSWGLIISNRSQSIALRICFWIMIFLLTLALISIWSSFLY